MSSEALLSKHLMARLKKEGHGTRIENMATPGTPDVAYTIKGSMGYIENKYLAKLPFDYPGIVKLSTFRASQRVWLSRHAAAGGRSFVLLHIGTPSTYVLFDGRFAAEHLGKVTQDKLRRGALVWRQTDDFPWDEIRRQLV